jgi:hypothetical protein
VGLTHAGEHELTPQPQRHSVEVWTNGAHAAKFKRVVTMESHCLLRDNARGGRDSDQFAMMPQPMECLAPKVWPVPWSHFMPPRHEASVQVAFVDRIERNYRR